MPLDINKIVINYISSHPLQSSREIYNGLALKLGYATLKRLLNQLLSENLVTAKGKGKGTKYVISSTYELLHPIDVESYFAKEQDERTIKDGFNFSLTTDTLRNAHVFTEAEHTHLQSLHIILPYIISHC